jgi:hypothetical protein
MSSLTIAHVIYQVGYEPTVLDQKKKKKGKAILPCLQARHFLIWRSFLDSYDSFFADPKTKTPTEKRGNMNKLDD